MYDTKLQFNQVVYYVNRSWDANPKIVSGNFICRDDNHPYTYTILDYFRHTHETGILISLKRQEFWTDESEAKKALAEELRIRIIHAQSDVDMMRKRMQILLGEREEEFDGF